MFHSLTSSMAIYLSEKTNPATFRKSWTTHGNTKAKCLLFMEANEITKKTANAIIMSANGTPMSRV